MSTDALGNPQAPRQLRKIPKTELRKIKQQVSKLRKKGHEVWTDDEVLAAGFTLGEPPPQSVDSLVSKTRQQQSWDCGLACTEMALSALGLEGSSSGHVALRSRLSSQSVWTIDLAYLLVDYGVDCQYLFASCDVDEDALSRSAFYAESLDADAKRVRLLFSKVGAHSVSAAKRSLSAAELWNLLQGLENIVIVLVDAGALPNGKVGVDFAGHYVLVTGVDEDRDGYYYKDPAQPDATSFIRCSSLDKARRTMGTDEDLIIIPVYQPTPEPPSPNSVSSAVRLVRTALQQKSEDDATR